ncbi:DJ-1/PfpI family protein [Methylobacterium nodulans]|uniref:ThiJ/PfpI domain protein n=1 Tax=Methylobacterium nodulans (strain LMG 21967 / CNCM I-2342 / ORS 2060) TaxID=460265 RepID=B8IS27_METNO|nr:DJ-1/PfpI family protein [Methylobacterium nodulans]ACL56839.1 ThiJ/PfpI domain protein [Methylobacterium nodulans ORS 2060]
MSLRFGILVFPAVQQLDLTGPYEVFASAAGAEVHLVWKDLAPVVSATGLTLNPTATFETCPPLDVLCVPGGSGINALLEDEATLRFLRERAAAARFVTSVCTGSLVLGAAGLLAGRRATTHWNALDFLAAFGATAVEDRIVRDGSLITAGGVTSGIDFGLAVVAALLGEAEAQTVQLCLEYAPAPPFAAGTPGQAPPAILAQARERLAGSRAAREAILARLKHPA